MLGFNYFFETSRTLRIEVSTYCNFSFGTIDGQETRAAISAIKTEI